MTSRPQLAERERKIRRAFDTVVGDALVFRTVRTKCVVSELIGEVPVSRSTVRAWAKRGWITRRWTNGRSTIYRVSEKARMA